MADHFSRFDLGPQSENAPKIHPSQHFVGTENDGPNCEFYTTLQAARGQERGAQTPNKGSTILNFSHGRLVQKIMDPTYYVSTQT